MSGTAPTPVRKLKQRRKAHQFAFVLLSQFALIASYPLIGATNGARPGTFGMIAMVLFLAGLYQVTEERDVRIIAVTLCILGTSANVLAIVGYNGAMVIPTGLFAIAYMAFVTGVILWKVLSAPKVTVETLYGAACAYLFIAIVWGMLYSFVDLVSPGSFRYTYDATKRLVWPDYSFFSVVTLTTIGYGDIVPIGAVKGLVMMEGIIGAMYPPILIGRLLTLHARSD